MAVREMSAVKDAQMKEAAEKSGRSVFVGNIPYEASDEEIKDIFGQAGPVLSFRLVYDRESGKPKGYGFCEYKDQETAQSAMRNLNGTELHGRQLRVDSAASQKGANDDPAAMMKEISPYGNAVAPEKAPETITSAVASLPPEQMFELMKQMKLCIQNNPEEARQMLLQNPQLAYALLQAQVIMKIVDPKVADAILHQPRGEPLPIKQLMDHAGIGPTAGASSGPPTAPLKMAPPTGGHPPAGMHMQGPPNSGGPPMQGPPMDHHQGPSMGAGPVPGGPPEWRGDGPPPPPHPGPPPPHPGEMFRGGPGPNDMRPNDHDDRMRGNAPPGGFRGPPMDMPMPHIPGGPGGPPGGPQFNTGRPNDHMGPPMERDGPPMQRGGSNPFEERMAPPRDNRGAPPHNSDMRGGPPHGGLPMDNRGGPPPHNDMRSGGPPMDRDMRGGPPPAGFGQMPPVSGPPVSGPPMAGPPMSVAGPMGGGPPPGGMPAPAAGLLAGLAGGGPGGPSEEEKQRLIMQVLNLTEDQIRSLPDDQRESILLLKSQIGQNPPR